MVDSSFWGSGAWKLFHCMTYTYPDKPSYDHKKALIDLVDALQYLLPCSTCRTHFRAFVLNNPLTEDITSSKENVIMWMIDAHNNANQRTNKPILTYNEVISQHQKLISPSSSSYIIPISCVIIMLCVIGVIVYKKLNKKL